jgi:hypothetical protein
MGGRENTERFGSQPVRFGSQPVQEGKKKKLSVYKALQDSKWITHILPLQTSQEIQE